MQGDPAGHVADRAEAEHEQGATLGHVGVRDRLPGGGQDVGEEHEALVRRALRHLDRHELGLRHPQVLRLGARHLAVQLAEAEQRGAHALVAHLGGLALRVQPLGAHPAVPATDLERHDDPVPDLEVARLGADLLDDAHRLVTEDVALAHERAERLVEVQVRAADSARGDPDDRIVRFLEIGSGTSSTRTSRRPCQVTAFMTRSLVPVVVVARVRTPTTARHAEPGPLVRRPGHNGPASPWSPPRDDGGMDQQLVTRAADVLLADGRSRRSDRWRGGPGRTAGAARRGGGRQSPAPVLRQIARPRIGTSTDLVEERGRHRRDTGRHVAGTIVAVATAERTEPDAAEVAFLVADNEHGRGPGQPAAGASGRRLQGHGVSPLRRRGPARERSHDPRLPGRRLRGIPAKCDSGVVLVEMSTEASASAVAAADLRECVSEARSLAPLLYPRTVAVVGVRRDVSGLGHAVLTSIIDGHFQGPCPSSIPRSPRSRVSPPSRGWSTSQSHVDVALVAVPATRVLAAVEDAAEAGVSAVVVISSGLGELGPEGAGCSVRCSGVARENNIRLVGPNCLGVMSNDPAIRLNATFSRTVPPPGGLAVASQSGGVGIALLDVARDLGLGVQTFISLGNKADVSSNDLLAAWIDDPQVTAAALYLESFGNAPKFARMARRFAERKPLLAVVGGRSAGGQRAGPRTLRPPPHRPSESTPCSPRPASSAVAARRRWAEPRCCWPSNRFPPADGSPSSATPAVWASSRRTRPTPPASSCPSCPRACGPARRARRRDRRDEQPGRPRGRRLGRQPRGRARAAAGFGRGRRPAGRRGAHERGTRRAAARDDGAGPRRCTPTSPWSWSAWAVCATEVPGVTVFHAVDHAIEALGHAAATPSGDAPRRPTRGRTILTGPRRPGRGAGAGRAGRRCQLGGRRGGQAAPGALRADAGGRRARTRWKRRSPRTSSGFRSRSRSPTEHRAQDRPWPGPGGAESPGGGRRGPGRLRTELGREDVPVLIQPVVDGVEVALGVARDPGFGPLVMVAAGGIATGILEDRAFLLPPFSGRTPPGRSGRCASGRSSTATGARPRRHRRPGGSAGDAGRAGHRRAEIAELDFNPVMCTPTEVLVDVKVRLAAAAPRRGRPPAAACRRERRSRGVGAHHVLDAGVVLEPVDREVLAGHRTA